MNTHTQNKNNVTQSKLDYEVLRQSVQGFKLVNLKCNQAEIALISGWSKRTMQTKGNLIDELWAKDSDTPNNDKKFILDNGIKIGIAYVCSKIPEHIQEHMLGVILGTYLKVETGLLDKSDSLKRAWIIGRHIISIYNMMCGYKSNEDGTSIHSDKNKSAKHLLDTRNFDKPNFDKLFLRSDSYEKDKDSKKWLPTELLIDWITASTDVMFDLISKFDINKYLTLDYPLLVPHMLRENDAIPETGQDKINNNINDIYNNVKISNDNAKAKKPFFIVDRVRVAYTVLTAPKGIVEKFETNSKLGLISRAYKYDEDGIHIPIKHRAKGDESWGRTYNVFCTLRSHERLQLGYISYDMSAAMQSICLGLIQATEEDYPMLWKYSNDKAYKKRIRTEIAQDLSIDEDTVKSKLTAFANGSITEIDKHPYYKTFQAESDKLRRVVLKHVRELDPDVFKRAEQQSRKAKDLPKELDWLDTESKETAKDMRIKSSVFFFVWTWYERKIRQAMLFNLLQDGIEVHDAVYSKIDIDVNKLENEIYIQTGFKIIIEKEMPVIGQ